MSKIMYKDKPYMSTTDLPEMTLTEARTGTEEEPRVISPKTLFEFAVNRLTGNIDIDTSAASGDDYDLTQALTSLGWLSDVVTSGVLGMKKLLHKTLGMFIPQEYTGYTFSAYTQTDGANSYVYIVGKLCIFSLSMKYTSNYTPTDTQPFILNMPIPIKPVLMQGITYGVANQSNFYSFRYRINEIGTIQNWYSGLKTVANNPTVFSGVYVIA